MRFIYLLLAMVIAASPCKAETFGFAFMGITATTGLDGTATMSVQIPGTFGGLVPVDPANGRYLKSAMLWCDNPVAGDQLSLLQIVDTDGVVPQGARVAFPNYPVIFDLLDSATGGTKALFIPSGGITAEAFDSTGQTSMRMLPSQLYLKLTYQAGGLGISKTFRGVIRWGLWQ